MTARRRRPERVFMKSAEAMAQADDFHQRIRALEALGGGKAIYAIEVFESDTIVVAGDNAFEWEIPEDLDGSTLLKVEGYVNDPSSAGAVQVQLAKRDGTGALIGDLLTSKIVIEAGELNSKDAVAQPVVDAGAISSFVWGDHIRVDVDAAGADTFGLGVIAYFVPLITKTLAVEGAKGDPGGVTEWTGEWNSGTTYTVGQAVSHNGTSYVAIVGSTNVEPGVDAGWELVWMVLSEGNRASTIEVFINGNGLVLDPGVKADVEVPFNCTISQVVMMADQAGDAEVEIWKDVYANYPPTSADNITGATPPTIAAAVKSIDTALVGWTTAIVAGDILRFNLNSCTSITRLTISVTVLR